MTWVTSQGTYKTNLKKEATTITVDNLSQISSKTCYDILTWTTNNKIKSIDTYLRQYYNLNGSTLQLAQTKVNNIGNRYRILYSNNKLKQT